MPYNIVSKTATVGTSTTDVYTNLSDASIIVGLSASNNLVGIITISIELYTDSSSTSFDIIAPNTILVEGETLTPIGGLQKVSMNTNDIIKITCSDIDGVDVIISAMELNDYV